MGGGEGARFEIVDTTVAGFALTALGALGILAALFLYALVLEPALGLPGLKDHPAWLALFVSGSCVLFLWFILAYGPSRFIRVYARPPQPFLGREKTLEILEGQNRADYPFELVPAAKYDLVVQHKLADADWRGVLFRGGLRATFWLYVHLDESTRTAWLVEKRRSLSWNAGAGPGKLAATVDFSIFYGIAMTAIRRELVYDPLAAFRKIADHAYNVADVKQPVIGLLVEAGWTVRYKVVPLQVRNRRP